MIGVTLYPGLELKISVLLNNERLPSLHLELLERRLPLIFLL